MSWRSRGVVFAPEYRWYNPEYGGTVRFRFFLGDDVSRNFDVLRDHYYKVTLQLEGNAVTEGGQVDENGDLTVDGSQVTWRVESDLRNVVIETGDIIVGGSGEYYPIDISGLESPRIYVKTENSSAGTTMFVHYFNDAGDGSGKNQSNRLTSQHKQSQGVVGIFGDDAKSHDLTVGKVSKIVMGQLEREYPQLSFRYRDSIKKDDK